MPCSLLVDSLLPGLITTSMLRKVITSFGMSSQPNNDEVGQTASDATPVTGTNGHGDNNDDNAINDHTTIAAASANSTSKVIHPSNSNTGSDSESDNSTSTGASRTVTSPECAKMSATAPETVIHESKKSKPNADVIPDEVKALFSCSKSFNQLTQKGINDISKVITIIGHLKAHKQLKKMDNMKSWLASAGYLVHPEMPHATEMLCEMGMQNLVNPADHGGKWAKPLGDNDAFRDGGALYNHLWRHQHCDLNSVDVANKMFEEGAWVKLHTADSAAVDARSQEGTEEGKGHDAISSAEVEKDADAGDGDAAEVEKDADAGDGDAAEVEKDAEAGDGEGMDGAFAANQHQETKASGGVEEASCAGVVTEPPLDPRGIISQDVLKWKDEAERNETLSAVSYLFKKMNETSHGDKAAKVLCENFLIGTPNGIEWKHIGHTDSDKWKNAVTRLVEHACGKSVTPFDTIDEMVKFIGKTWKSESAFKRSYTEWIKRVRVVNPPSPKRTPMKFADGKSTTLYSPPPAKRARLGLPHEDVDDTKDRPRDLTIMYSKFNPTHGGKKAFDALMPEIKGKSFKIRVSPKQRGGLGGSYRYLSDYEDKEGEAKEKHYMFGMSLYTLDGASIVTTSQEVNHICNSDGYRAAASNAPAIRKAEVDSAFSYPWHKNEKDSSIHQPKSTTSATKPHDAMKKPSASDLPQGDDLPDKNKFPYALTNENYLPGMNSDLPGSIVNRPFTHKGMEPTFLPGGALVNNLSMIRDGQQCEHKRCGRLENNSCGGNGNIVPGQNVYVLGEDIHIVKQRLAYIGVYIVDAWGTISCKIGVVKCLPYQINHYQNRHAIVMDLMYERDDTGKLIDSPVRATSRRHPVEKLVKGVAAIRFVDGKSPYINTNPTLPYPVVPFQVDEDTAQRWGWEPPANKNDGCFDGGDKNDME